MAEPDASRARLELSAAERVLDDVELLSRILWSGGGKVLSIRQLCTAACVRRSWRDAVCANSRWRRLVLAFVPSFAALESEVKARGRFAFFRVFAQLHRAGHASLPPAYYLDYTVLVDVWDVDKAIVAHAAVPLCDLSSPARPSFRARFEGRTGVLPDGGAAAARFLARVASGAVDPRPGAHGLRLRMFLRRTDGALAVLAHKQSDIRFEDDPEVTRHGDQYDANVRFCEHAVWEAGEPARCRRGALTWHSRDAYRASSRLFGSSVAFHARADDTVHPARWAWRLQFPADEGAVPQLSHFTLSIWLRVKVDSTLNPSYVNVRFDAFRLAAMLEGREAKPPALWTPF